MTKPLFRKIEDTKQLEQNAPANQPLYYFNQNNFQQGQPLYYIDPSLSFAYHYLINIQQSGGFIENTIISVDRNGFAKLEVQAIYDNGSRKLFVIKNLINVVDLREIHVNNFANKVERNIEIKRLYKSENLTQEFLGKVFGLHQTTISGIINL